MDQREAQKITLVDAVKAEVDRLIAHYKEAMGDGKLQLAEVWKIFSAATASIVTVLGNAGSYEGAIKKEVVLDYLGTFYDQAVEPLDIPFVPGWIESRFVDPQLKKLFLTMAAGAIDTFVSIFNRVGWEPKQDPASDPTPGSVPVPDGFQPY